MTINPLVMNAILAMDAYNRGYNQNIDFRLKNSQGQPIEGSDVVIGTTMIGNYTVYDNNRSAAAQDKGFYAIAYEGPSGDRTISYRGTDDAILDPAYGWTVGLDQANGAQAQMAFQFYRNVIGDIDPRTADITLTGHSLGGGLAGLVGSAYGVYGILFNNMAFEGASVFLQSNALTDLDFKDLVYGNYNSGNTWARSVTNLSAYFLHNEVMSHTSTPGDHVGQQTNTTLVTPGDSVNFTGLPYPETNPIEWAAAHSIATLAISLYGQESVSGIAWQSAAKYFWPVLYNDAFFQSITYGIKGTAATNGEWSDIVRTAIAYSAIDEGTKIYGDTGIVSLFNDANDFGAALNATGVSTTLTNYVEDISESYVEFAASLALSKTLKATFPSVVNGTLTYTDAIDNHTLSFKHMTDSTRSGLINNLLDTVGNIESVVDAIAHDYHDWEDFISKVNLVDAIDRVVLAALDASTTNLVEIITNDPHYLSLFAGGNGTDIVTGTSRADILMGLGGNDVLYGGGSDDILIGGVGADTIYGGAGDDVFVGQGGATSLDGDVYHGDYATGDDTLTYASLSYSVQIDARNGAVGTAQKWDAAAGVSGAVDVFDGMSIILGTDHRDNILLRANPISSNSFEQMMYVNGAGGNDLYTIYLNHDDNYNTRFDITDSEGQDSIEFIFEDASSMQISVYADETYYSLSIQASSGTSWGSTYIQNVYYGQIEDLIISGNHISGTKLEKYLSTEGNVSLDLADFISTLNSRVYGGTGNDSLYGNGSNNVIYGGEGDDSLSGGDGNDKLYGEAGSDILSGDAGNDILYGGDGDDQLIGGLGNDTIDGGAGTDTVSYSSSISAVTINLATTTAQNTIGAGLDTILNVEYIVGSSYNDTLTGNGGSNIIEGGAGDDILDGSSGTDTVSYASATGNVVFNLSITTAQNTNSAGFDTVINFERVRGSDYDDNITGDAGNNNLSAGNGNDWVEGGLGNDTLIGGAGIDTVAFTSSTTGVTVNLATVTPQNTGVGTDLITGFENLSGSAFADFLMGNSGDNVIQGRGGSDNLIGGLGADIFVFDTSGLGASDTVLDFNVSQNDKLDISDLLFGYDPLSSAIEDFVSFTTSGYNSIMSVDRDGAGTAYSSQGIASLTAVTGLDADTLHTSGNLIA